MQYRLVAAFNLPFPPWIGHGQVILDVEPIDLANICCRLQSSCRSGLCSRDRPFASAWLAGYELGLYFEYNHRLRQYDATRCQS